MYLKKIKVMLFGSFTPTGNETRVETAKQVFELLLKMLRYIVSFQDECHNFIKVLVPRNDDLVFICGTNGFNPMCRYYRVGICCHLLC